MNRSETFLTRWSRLKRDDLHRPETAEEPPSPTPDAARGDEAAPAAASDGRPPPQPAPDLPALPDIDAITSGSDIRAFLAAGVPAELTKAALRRAWTVDPAIRDFIGLAENQWDFTDPTSIPGFGPLAPTEDVGRLVSQALGQGLSPPTPPAQQGGSSQGRVAPSCPQESRQDAGQVHGIPERNRDVSRWSDAVENQQKIDLAATQHPQSTADDGRLPSRRSHGRALPK
ncbi:MAG TPA: DUF3306 domain-containing protein [Hyphomicrobiaceae bacterium]|nr:DUF3306 domain-containing protein [Hyphomicrobiaceae bacterium]